MLEVSSPRGHGRTRHNAGAVHHVVRRCAQIQRDVHAHGRNGDAADNAVRQPELGKVVAVKGKRIVDLAALAFQDTRVVLHELIVSGVALLGAERLASVPRGLGSRLANGNLAVGDKSVRVACHAACRVFGTRIRRAIGAHGPRAPRRQSLVDVALRHGGGHRRVQQQAQAHEQHGDTGDKRQPPFAAAAPASADLAAALARPVGRTVRLLFHAVLSNTMDRATAHIFRAIATNVPAARTRGCVAPSHAEPLFFRMPQLPRHNPRFGTSYVFEAHAPSRAVRSIIPHSHCRGPPF